MLHLLMDYAKQKNMVSQVGYAPRAAHWSVALNRDGIFLELLPLGLDAKKGKVFNSPTLKSGFLQGSVARSHFLLESAQVVFKWYANEKELEKAERVERRRDFFKDLFLSAAKVSPLCGSVALFLANESEVEKARLEIEGKQGAKTTQGVTFHVDDLLLLECHDWKAWWNDFVIDLNKSVVPKGRRAAVKVVSLLDGQQITPVATHDKIKGLAGVGGLGTGDNLISFDKAAFHSYGLKKSDNAAMDEEGAKRYSDVLNQLIKQYGRKLGQALVVPWYKQEVKRAENPFVWTDQIENPSEEQERDAMAQMRDLLGAIQAGERPDLKDNHFYVLTLSGVSGRVMVRDWMEGRFEQLVEHVLCWFNDLSIVHRDGSGLAPHPKFLAVVGSMYRELKDIPAPLIAQLWRVAILNQKIPHHVMAQALLRVRMDLVLDKPFNHARMGLLKAFFCRSVSGGEEMKPFMNPDHPDPIYHCGRLMAILARLQYAALGDVGAGVVQRYYTAMSQTPALILGRLISNAKNHLNKLDGGLARWYEDQIADLMVHIGDHPPKTLTLEGQSLFALGYYQQMAHDRAEAQRKKSEKA
ncbi:type I-C CRISPR-associated protein Cas8c/Csd1 [Magnetococcales bacterium HHB-1]